MTGGNSDQLWTNLKAKGIADDTIGKLQLDGKLGYLTLQNAPLVKKLYDAFQVTDPIDLVKRGLYKPAAWKDLVSNDLPPGVTADNYATSMSNLLTLSYPTAVAAEMVRNKEISLHANAPLDDVYTFLNSNKQNTLGVNPVKQWENYKQARPETQAAVKRGDPLSKKLEEHPVFPPMVVQMMAVGEETGALDEMLDKIADFYDQEVEATVEALTSLIEPLLIVVMGLVVLAIVMAILLPIFQISQLAR